MKHLVVLFLLLLTNAFGAQIRDFQQQQPTVSVQNRVLCRVEDKAISVVDVLKKMELIFDREFPEYKDNAEAKYHFFNNNWRFVLAEIIDRELILADAKKKEVAVSQGDVREEIEMIFGPDIMQNLDRANLTYDETWQQIHDDIMVRRLLMGKVNSKALMTVGPKVIKDAYREFVQRQKASRHWVYQVVSIRGGKNPQALAKTVRDALEKTTIGIDGIDDFVASQDDYKDSRVSITEELERDEKSVSPAHREVLEKTLEGSFSPTCHQKTRRNEDVFRIFFVKTSECGKCPSFQAICKNIREDLIQRAIALGTRDYVESLRKSYGIDNDWLSALEKDRPPIFRLTL